MSASESPVAKKAKTTHDNSLTDTLQIIVGTGKDATSFLLKKSTIISKSEYFQRACKTEWKSGKDSIVILEDQDPLVFSIFYTYIATSNISLTGSYLGSLKIPFDRCIGENHRLQLIRCFVLGEMLISSDFQNAVLDLLVPICKLVMKGGDAIPCTSIKSLQLTVEDTPPGSRLRALVLDCITEALDRNLLRKWVRRLSGR